MDINKLKKLFTKYKKEFIKRWEKDKKFRVVSIILMIEFILILSLYIFIGTPGNNKLQEMINKEYENQIHISDLDQYIKDNKDDILKITLPAYDNINYFEILKKDENGKLEKEVVYKDINKDWKDYNLDSYKDIKNIGFYTDDSGVNIATIFGIIFNLIFFSFIIIIAMQMLGLGTKSGIKLFDRRRQEKIELDDLGGIEGQKEEITDLINSIKQYENLEKRGVRPPRGILFYGPPGTGKTMLAKAIASNADIDMFTSTAADFGSKYINEGPQKVKKAYSEMEKFFKKHDRKLGILFIDELEQLFKKRGSGHSEDDKVLTTFLERINGIEKREANIIVIGATNDISMIDDAVLSRFDKKIAFNLPTRSERKEITEKILTKIKEQDPLVRIDKDLDLSVFAANTYGKAGRDLDNIINEVHRIAVMNNNEIITAKMIQRVYADIELGKDNKGLEVNIDDKNTITYHELGHATIGYLNGNKTVHTITCIPKGPALGITWLIDKTEKVLKTPDYFLKEIQGLLAGREAEKLFCNGIITTGASNDYERATALAFSYFIDYNFNYEGFELGYVYKPGQQNQLIESNIFKLVMPEVKKMLAKEMEKVQKVLKSNKSKIEKLAKRLNEFEIIHEKDIIEVFNNKKEKGIK